jgi:small-conductance mechanosensitive channel
MSQLDLKKMIKQLVKESLQEILLEEYIKNTVKKAITENLTELKKSSLNENTQTNTHIKEKDIMNFLQNPVQSHSANSQVRPTKPTLDKKLLVKKIMGEDVNINPYLADILEQTAENYKEEETVLQESAIRHASQPEQIKDVPEDFLKEWGLIGQNKSENKAIKAIKSEALNIQQEKEFEALREKRRQLLSGLVKK